MGAVHLSAGNRLAGDARHSPLPCNTSPLLHFGFPTRVQAGGDSLPAAIQLAQQAQDPAAAAVVLEHLQAVDGMGAALLELHLSLGNHEQACAVAVARAQQEQAVGNYKVSLPADYCS